MEEPKEEVTNETSKEMLETLKNEVATENKIAVENDNVIDKKKLSTSVFEIASKAVSVLLVVLFVFIIYSAISGWGGNGIAVGPFKIFNVLTGSMQPTISQGSLVLTESVAKKDLNVGDIITFMPSKDTKVLLTHRIVSEDVKPDFYVTRGDANNIDDNPVHYNNIVGKVIFHVPFLGLLLSISSSPYGVALVAIIFALFMFLVEIVKRIVKG